MNTLLKKDKADIAANFGKPMAVSASLAAEIANQGIPASHVNDLHNLISTAAEERDKDSFLINLLSNISYIADQSLGMDQYLGNIFMGDVIKLFESRSDQVVINLMDFIQIISKYS